MRKVTSVISPVIAVDRHSSKPLHRQIYDAYRAAVVGRKLRSGQQIPSSRGLAVELGISRIPVITAYSQLLAEGYFESRAGSGADLGRRAHIYPGGMGLARPHRPRQAHRHRRRAGERKNHACHAVCHGRNPGWTERPVRHPLRIEA